MDKYLQNHINMTQLQNIVPETTYDPFKVQVGGDHYSRFPIQPLEYIEKNKLPFADGCVVKYITRWRFKGGIEDLRKAKHFIEMLIILEERKDADIK